MDNTWKITVPYGSQRFEFFGIFNRGEFGVEAYCDHAVLSTSGSDASIALDKMTVQAILLLEQYNSLGKKEIQNAIDREELWLLPDLVSA